MSRSDAVISVLFLFLIPNRNAIFGRLNKVDTLLNSWYKSVNPEVFVKPRIVLGQHF